MITHDSGKEAEIEKGEIKGSSRPQTPESAKTNLRLPIRVWGG